VAAASPKFLSPAPRLADADAGRSSEHGISSRLFAALLSLPRSGALRAQHRRSGQRGPWQDLGHRWRGLCLLGLLLAFTFSGAASRFDGRRELIVAEANAIGTAQLRLDVVPAEAQPKLREAFQRYVAARIDAYRDLDNVAGFKAKLAVANDLQKEVWQLAVEAGLRADARRGQHAVAAALNEASTGVGAMATRCIRLP
jgi:hypothetical protein